MKGLKSKIHSETIRSYILIFSFGAVFYSALEMLYRGHTHFTMVILGGICGMVIHRINRTVTDSGIIIKALLCMFVITLLEFFAGIILNLILGLRVWDYSNRYFHILGQICPLFSFCWFLISIPALFISTLIDRNITPYLKGKLLFK